MKLAHSLWLALAISIIGSSGWAADADPHQAHHPAGTASAPATKAMPGKARPDMTRMDTQMKSMREMHDKMMAARHQAMAARMEMMQATMQLMVDRLPAAPSN